MSSRLVGAGSGWYEEYVPIADRLYNEHLETLRKEGLKDGS